MAGAGRFNGRRRWGRAIAGVCASFFALACGSTGGSLTQAIEARRLASELRVQFTQAVDAANLAVMADTDEGSAHAARQAEEATGAAAETLERLQPILQALAYAEERRALDAFRTRFEEYRKLDAEILPLAVENTNLKAQRLSFGPAREAADAFRQAMDRAVRSGEVNDAPRVEALAAKAWAAVLEIRVLQAPHIAESEDEAMTRFETQMAASGAAARGALARLKPLLGPAARAQVAAAAAALDRFESVNAEIVALSRRNSNVRSLALSLGRKRKVVAGCDDQLRALEAALTTHPFPATR